MLEVGMRHVYSDVQFDLGFSQYLVWMQEVGPVDPDIDPVHNPQWVARRRVKEMMALERAKERTLDLAYGYVLPLLQGTLYSEGPQSRTNTCWYIHLFLGPEMPAQDLLERMVDAGDLVLNLDMKLEVPEGWTP